MRITFDPLDDTHLLHEESMRTFILLAMSVLLATTAAAQIPAGDAALGTRSYDDYEKPEPAPPATWISTSSGPRP